MRRESRCLPARSKPMKHIWAAGRRINRPTRNSQAGRGAVGKAAVAGIKDRASGNVKAQVVEKTDAITLQGFVEDRTVPGAQVYTDDASAYKGITRPYEAVKHSVGEYVRDMAHTNDVESLWAGLKRGYDGVYHKMSRKHLDRYVSEFAGRHNNRNRDTID